MRKKPAMKRHTWAVESVEKPGTLWLRPEERETLNGAAGTPYLFASKRAARFWGRPIKVRLFLERERS